MQARIERAAKLTHAKCIMKRIILTGVRGIKDNDDVIAHT